MGNPYNIFENFSSKLKSFFSIIFPILLPVIMGLGLFIVVHGIPFLIGYFLGWLIQWVTEPTLAWYGASLELWVGISIMMLVFIRNLIMFPYQFSNENSSNSVTDKW